MQATIDDVSYNTALSHEIAHFSDGRQRGDPLHTFEVLYRTGSAWFLRRRRDGCENYRAFDARGNARVVRAKAVRLGAGTLLRPTSKATPTWVGRLIAIPLVVANDRSD